MEVFFCAGDFNDSLSFNICISFDCKLETFWPSALQHKKTQILINFETVNEIRLFVLF